ncbi:sensor histidine kinase [Paenibacillus sp. strain BS8-2]
MLFVLIALWSIAAIVWVSEPSSAVNRRLGALAFTGGSGALAAMIDLEWLPQATQNGAGIATQRILYELQALSSLSSYYGIPYFFLLFAIAYNGIRMNSSLTRTLPLVLLLPIVMCVLLTPYYTTAYPISYKVVVWWAVPYILAGAVLVLAKRVPPSAYARTHWIVICATLPPMLFCMCMNYILPSFGMLRMWVYNTWLVLLGASVFVIGLFTYGFMGVRVMIQRKRYDSTLRAVTSGTAMLNHAIKNDAGKLRLFGEKMKRYAVATEQKELLQDVEAVLSASRHMEEMVRRVHRRTEDMEIRPERIELAALLREGVEQLKPAGGAVRLETNLAEGWICNVDKAQLLEAFTNIAMNGIEALSKSDVGVLRVELTAHKSDLVIEIADNGPGITREQKSQMFEPFYTTKPGSGNFGLGLPYAMHVMRKHKGSLSVRSREGEGAAFYLSLPKRAIQAERISGGTRI